MAEPERFTPTNAEQARRAAHPAKSREQREQEDAAYEARRLVEKAEIDAALAAMTPEELVAHAFSAEVTSPPRHSGRMHSGDLVKHLRGDIW